MLLLRTEKLPEGSGWQYEVKFDGYRALAIKTSGMVQLRSRTDKDFSKRYPGLVAALAGLPDETVIDGEVVALDAAGKPVFSLLQNGGTKVHFYVFDLLLLAGKDLTGEPLVKRRELLERRVLPALSEPVRCSPVLEVSLSDLIQSIRAQGLEGLVAKLASSRYEAGQRSGAWLKMRVNLAQEFLYLVFRDVAALFNDLKPLHMTDGVCSLGNRSFYGFARTEGRSAYGLGDLVYSRHSALLESIVGHF